MNEKPVCSKCIHRDRCGWCAKHDIDVGWYTDGEGPERCGHYEYVVFSQKPKGGHNA